MGELLNAEGVAVPSVGRIVHVTDGFGEGPFAAIVTGVEEGPGVPLIAATVFRRRLAPQLDQGLEHDSSGSRPHTWRWPPRV